MYHDEDIPADFRTLLGFRSDEILTDLGARMEKLKADSRL